MAILMDLTNYHDGRPTPNSNHVLNPQRLEFITCRAAATTNDPGVGPDGVYRDIWGNPYIITIHLNDDKRGRDPFYRLASVSELDAAKAEGLNGLARPEP